MKHSLYYKTGQHMIGNVDFADRWNDLRDLIEADPSHIALDVGCAEGLISISLSKMFKEVHAFDIEPYRIQQAKNNAKGIKNIFFSTKNYLTYDYQNYDQIFCLGVYHKIKSISRQRSLDTMFKKCNSMLYLRIPVIDKNVSKTVGVPAAEVLKIAVDNDFELVHRTKQVHLHGTIFKFKRR